MEKEARPAASLLLTAIVGDVRFEQRNWSPLARIIEMVNQTLSVPLVDHDTIHRYMTGS